MQSLSYTMSKIFKENFYKNLMFEIKECKSKGGYTVKPLKNLKLDFAKIKKNFKIIFDSPIALVIQEDGIEIVIHKYGELLVKKCRDIKKIETLAKRIYT